MIQWWLESSSSSLSLRRSEPQCMTLLWTRPKRSAIRKKSRNWRTNWRKAGYWKSACPILVKKRDFETWRGRSLELKEFSIQKMDHLSNVRVRCETRCVKSGRLMDLNYRPPGPEDCAHEESTSYTERDELLRNATSTACD